jgi:RNA polymerase subunit RPABC4/transcription elongation factor Spt4/preprotein translocase subunit SecG
MHSAETGGVPLDAASTRGRVLKGQSELIETAARGAQFFLAIGIAYLIALWFALVAWTFRDIESRSRSVFTQVFSTLLVVLFFVPGLLLYLILRPKETLDQVFQRALEEEYLLQDLDELPLCPGCQRSVDADFVICPHCQTSLRHACASCSRLIDRRWAICPYCAAPVTADGDLPVRTIDAKAAEPVKQSKRERAIAAAAERIGATPDELDAFTDALSRGNGRPAVGAGSRRTYIVPADADPPTLTEASVTPRTESRFWAEPLPAPDATRTRDTTG